MRLCTIRSGMCRFQFLLSEGAWVNHQETSGQTPLMHAVVRGYLDIAETLLEGGADPNLRTDRWGLSAMDMARGRGNQDMIRLLLMLGSSLQQHCLAS